MANWHNNQVIYQVYPKSFQDSNDDGIGDIQGIIQRIPYLKSLGITTLWLNPIYVSPQIDNGYDVSNYYAIDGSFGTMNDIDDLITELHHQGMYLLMDFVMNHTSDQHPWFKDAVQHPDGLYRDYYLWGDNVENGYPNNWGSFFGGSVWEQDPGETDQYYFHLFDRHMPDLNWKNPEVRNSMFEIAKYWLAKGVDGFRLDAFIHIDKANFKQNIPENVNKPAIIEPFYTHLANVQPFLQEFCKRLRSLDSDVFILGEASSASPELLVDYSRPENDECNAVITFRSLVDCMKDIDPKLPIEFQPKSLDIEGMKRALATIEAKLADVSLPVLYWSNHDMARLASRYGSEHYRLQSLKCLATMLYLQRGIPIIYYGEELGMQNMNIEQLADFNDQTVDEFYEQALSAGYSHERVMQMLNRTHKMSARGPMQWDKTQAYVGFSASAPWLAGDTVVTDMASEQLDPDSLLNYYRQLLKLKQTELFTKGTEIIQVAPKGIFKFVRQFGQATATVTCNLTDQPVKVLSMGNEHVRFSGGAVEIDDEFINYGPWAFTIVQNLEDYDG